MSASANPYYSYPAHVRAIRWNDKKPKSTFRRIKEFVLNLIGRTKDDAIDY